MASGLLHHQGCRLIPIRGQSWTVGWWLHVSEIGRWCCGYLRMRRSTVDRRHTWSQTLRRYKYQCFQSYWLKDMAGMSTWPLSVMRQVLQRHPLYELKRECMTGHVCLPLWYPKSTAYHLPMATKSTHPVACHQYVPTLLASYKLVLLLLLVQFTLTWQCSESQWDRTIDNVPLMCSTYSPVSTIS